MSCVAGEDGGKLWNGECTLYMIFLPHMLTVICTCCIPSYPTQTTRSPTTQPSGGSRISTFSEVEAHMTIASDGIPLILQNTIIKISCCAISKQ